MKVSYYPGCSLHGTAKEYDQSVRAVSRNLGIDLEEIEDWSCCGASSAHATNFKLSIALPARDLIAAEKKRVSRVAYEVPIYDYQVGDSEGQVPIRRLQRKIMRLPRNLTAGQVSDLNHRLKALPQAMQMPKGPLPKTGRMPKPPRPRFR